MATPRIYLTGQVVIEHGDQLLRERGLAGRQGRVAFVYLALHRHRTIARDELSAAIWNGERTSPNDGSLDPILSKLRSALRSAGMTRDAGIDAASGSVALQLPSTAWVDIEAARNSLDEAEGALRRGDGCAAWGLANTAAVIASRPFLPDLEAPWIESQRAAQRAMQVRAVHCLATLSAANHEPLLAIQHAREMVDLDPFRETSYQLLMRLHAAVGDRAEALRVFARCRDVLRDELGVSPSPQTEKVYLEILRAE